MNNVSNKELITLIQGISYNRLRHCLTALDETKEAFPDDKINELDLSRWIHRFYDAITSDLIDSTDNNIKSAILDYSHLFNKVRFEKEKVHLVYALHSLRNIIVDNLHNEEMISDVIIKFSTVEKLIKDRHVTEAQIWNFAAYSIPYAILLALVLDFCFNECNYQKNILKFTIVGFFSVAVMWWWWAMSKIIIMSLSFTQFKLRFAELHKKLAELRTNLK